MAVSIIPSSAIVITKVEVPLPELCGFPNFRIEDREPTYGEEYLAYNLKTERWEGFHCRRNLSDRSKDMSKSNIRAFFWKDEWAEQINQLKLSTGWICVSESGTIFWSKVKPVARIHGWCWGTHSIDEGIVTLNGYFLAFGIPKPSYSGNWENSIRRIVDGRVERK